MRQPHFLLKIAAVTSSVLLVGGFIAYRAGAFDRLMGSGTTDPAPAAMGGSKSKVLITEPKPADTAEKQPTVAPVQLSEEEKRRMLMYSSKSIILSDSVHRTPVDRVPNTTQQPPPDTKPPSIMPSSKSAFPLIPVPSVPPSPSPDQPNLPPPSR
jgi:hypothetical protein